MNEINHIHNQIDELYDDIYDTDFYKIFSIELCSRDQNLRFGNIDELMIYLHDICECDGEYFYFHFQPLNAPFGTTCTISFRSIEAIADYLTKHHCSYL